jgi:hypothetical protein
MIFSPGLAGSRETAVILGQSRHSRAVSTVLDVSRSFSVSSGGLVCITGNRCVRHQGINGEDEFIRLRREA